MRRLLRISVIAILFFAVTGVGAEELELDPLLELLVEQGVITMEQALAVQAEYDRRRAAELVPTASPQAISSAPLEKSVAEEKEEKWYDRIDFKGDLRLRGEFFWVEGISSNDRRERFRARIRPGIYTDITDWMEVGLQVRSGDPLDPVSDNSSFDGGFSLIPLSISEGFAAFHPVDWLDLTFGKFDAKKKWVVTDMQWDMQWDDDVTVEGAMEEISFGPFKASLYQYILEEDKETRDAYLLGGQLSAKFGSDNIGSITVGAGYDEWVRPQMVADMTLSGKLHGNRVTNLLDDDDQLISEFEIANAFVTWRVGDYKKRGQMMFRASRYYSEPDALFYVFAQSDTTMASDVDGYRFDFRLGYVKKSYFNVTWYHTNPVYSLFPEMDRLQVDYIIVF
jgi:hypothetical protein